MGKQRRRSELHWRFAKALNAEENRALARQYRVSEGAERLAIRDAMIKGNQGLVIKVAERFTSSRLDFEDRIQEGNLGLLRAIEGYNPDREAFSTYAEYHIFVFMQRADMNTGSTIRVPVWAIKTKRKDKQDYVAAGNRARATVSLDAMMDRDDGVFEFAAASEDVEPWEASERLALVDQALGVLPERQQKVVRMCYGIGEPAATLTLIGERIGGVTPTRVQQICLKAEAALRRMPELLEVAS